MGRGDKKTRRGKIVRGTYGRLRPKKRKQKSESIRKDYIMNTDNVKITTITNKKTGEGIKIVQLPDEFSTQNPREYFRDVKLIGHLIFSGVPMNELNEKSKKSELGKKAFIEGLLLWKKKESEIDNTALPEELITLLSQTKKSDQEKLLRGTVLSSNILAALLFQACEKHGYTFHQIKKETPQKGIEVEKMPKAAIVEENGNVTKFGKSDLSAGQIKQAVDHRKVTIAKFLERGDHWHCFFTTYKSLKGEETWQGEGQPHYHYISDSFGIPKEEVIAQLKSEKYKLGNLPHIKLEDYGKQPSE